jgi:hypothetical protein
LRHFFLRRLGAGQSCDASMRARRTSPHSPRQLRRRL